MDFEIQISLIYSKNPIKKNSKAFIFLKLENEINVSISMISINISFMHGRQPVATHSQINFLKLNAQETNVNILISNNLLNCRTYFRCKDANKFEASNQHALYSFSFQTNNNILSPNFFINQAGINQADQSLEPLVCLNVCFWKVFPVCLIFLY